MQQHISSFPNYAAATMDLFDFGETFYPFLGWVADLVVSRLYDNYSGLQESLLLTFVRSSWCSLLYVAFLRRLARKSLHLDEAFRRCMRPTSEVTQHPPSAARPM